MSESTNVLSQSSSEPSAKAPSESLIDSKPSATPQTLEQWLDDSLPKLEELGHNEALRREIARKLS